MKRPLLWALCAFSLGLCFTFGLWVGMWSLTW